MSVRDGPAPGRWDFGLSAAEEARAARLHDACIIFDGMNQHPGGAGIFAEVPAQEVEAVCEKAGLEGLASAIWLPYRLATEGKSSAIRAWWRQSGVDVGTISVPTNPVFSRVHDVQQLQDFDWIKPVYTAAEIRRNKDNGVVSMWPVDQPIVGIPNNLGCIEEAYEAGLRSLMLTYNRMDYVGAGCTERCDAGLSMFGLDVVRRCNELGIIVDTSHCGRQTTLDACAFSRTPVIANHAAAKGVFDHARGKSDAELQAIAGGGGVIGVVAVPAFLSGEPGSTIEHMLDHVDYIARRVGWRHVGLGTDWPMQAPLDILTRTLGALVSEIGFRDQDSVSTDMVLRGFADGRDFPNITRGLVKRGYGDVEIAGILGENYLRVVEGVCG